MASYRFEHRQRPESFNRISKSTQWPVAKEIAKWREVFGWLGKDRSNESPRPIPQRVDILVITHRFNRLYLPDCTAHVIAAKGAVDGLVDAGVLRDDSPKYVRRTIFESPVVSGYDSLELVIMEIDDE